MNRSILVISRLYILNFIVIRLSTGRARGPWPEGRPGPTLKVRGPGPAWAGPDPQGRTGSGPGPALNLVRVQCKVYVRYCHQIWPEFNENKCVLFALKIRIDRYKNRYEKIKFVSWFWDISYNKDVRYLRQFWPEFDENKCVVFALQMCFDRYKNRYKKKRIYVMLLRYLLKQSYLRALHK
jgi:hypothetical protein